MVRFQFMNRTSIGRFRCEVRTSGRGVSSARGIELELLAWPDLAERVSAARVVLVPVGATEQHGPHLPLTTDTLIAERLCEAAAERTGALVAPAISVGCSYGHGTRIPGTISLTPEQLIAVVRQYTDWIARSGFRRILFVNAHAGNSSALSVATDYLRLERADLQVGTVNWWDLDPELQAEMVTDGQTFTPTAPRQPSSWRWRRNSYTSIG